MKLDVSVCICACNRPKELDRALESISQSSLAPTQVVVSDDSDDDRIRSLVADHGLTITYTKGPHLGLAANRNHAISLATGEHLLFLDDDATLGADFIARVERRLATLPAGRRTKAIFAGAEMKAGRMITPNKQGLLGFQSRAYRPNEPLCTVVINAALFPRVLFETLLFDPRLAFGSEEVDITTQAIAIGFSIIPCFDAINYHYSSDIGRESYFRDAQVSRLYVTLKRRRWTEKSPLRGWLGFGLAIIHTYLASIRRSGLAGFADARQVVAKSWEYYTDFRRSRVPGGSEAL